MSTSWSSPTPGRVVTGTAFGQPYERREPAGPPVRADAVAGVVAALVTVLTGAPVGLLWAQLAPRAQAVLVNGQYLRADPSSDAYIATDGMFAAALLVAGLVTGVLAWRLSRAHGPAVVPALAAGGLAAAYVAKRVGESVDLDGVRQAVVAGQERVDLPLALGATTALALWPGVALLAWLACHYAFDREGRRVSSG